MPNMTGQHLVEAVLALEVPGSRIVCAAKVRGWCVNQNPPIAYGAGAGRNQKHFENASAEESVEGGRLVKFKASVGRCNGWALKKQEPEAIAEGARIGWKKVQLVGGKWVRQRGS